MAEELEVGSLFLLSRAHLSLWNARVLYSKGLDLMYLRARLPGLSGEGWHAWAMPQGTWGWAGVFPHPWELTDLVSASLAPLSFFLRKLYVICPTPSVAGPFLAGF